MYNGSFGNHSCPRRVISSSLAPPILWLEYSQSGNTPGAVVVRKANVLAVYIAGDTSLTSYLKIEVQCCLPLKNM